MTAPSHPSSGIPELRPCPFCDSADVGFGRTGQKWQTVACNECGAEGPCTEIDHYLIIQKWNTRTPALPSGQAEGKYITMRFEDVVCAKPGDSCEWPECECRRKDSSPTPQIAGGVRGALIYTAELNLNGKYTWCIVEAFPRVENVIEEFGYGPDAYKAAQEKLAARQAALSPQAQGEPSHTEHTAAGIIDWKMEVERLNRLLGVAQASRGHDDEGWFQAADRLRPESTDREYLDVILGLLKARAHVQAGETPISIEETLALIIAWDRAVGQATMNCNLRPERDAAWEKVVEAVSRLAIHG